MSFNTAKKYLIDFVVWLGTSLVRCFIDFLAGLVFGLALQFIPAIISGSGGLVGYDSFSKIFPALKSYMGVYFSYLVMASYIVLGVIPFGIYRVRPLHKKYHTRNVRTLLISFFFFSLGILVSLVVWYALLLSAWQNASWF